MKQAENKNEEADGKEPKQGRIEEAQGIIRGNAKKAGEGLIQDQKQRGGGAP